MSHDLDSLIAAELRQLRLLIEPRRPLIERSLRRLVENLDKVIALFESEIGVYLEGKT